MYKELILLLLLLFLTVHFPFLLLCVPVFVNCPRLNLMFITDVFAVTLNSLSIIWVRSQEVMISQSLLERTGS